MALLGIVAARQSGQAAIAHDLAAEALRRLEGKSSESNGTQ